ncbi:NTP transferase domain-containing protein [Dietzia sp. PP-33]|uniref:NTP transferase domain-containing protein n=1 Tax=Dietzia sp. PP-33 TaxID=2957500 RepID=UPI0029BC6084|nr:NTP transferase domain-containing protein [Dietzia sp. PP-33]MDX2357911.1 NTP transferase domain-containing protein [Dietzia sp. PP-33]
MTVGDRPAGRDIAGIGAIVLAGGRASRLGGADKARIEVAGRPMLESVARAAASVADRVVTVGPGGDVREDPPFSGPVAGIAAGLAALPERADLVVVVACDLPDLDADTLRSLVASLCGPAALAVDAAGRDQYLLAAWDRRALAARLSALERSGGLAGRSVRSLYDDDEITRVSVGDPARDVDTWADLAARGPVAFAHVAAVLRSGLTPLPPTGRAPLDAMGAVLAAALVTVDPMPREPVSAMDGYALSGPGPWRLTEPARRAGDGSPVILPPGAAAPIATGAPAPTGTDRVLRHELVEVSPDGSGPPVVGALPAAAGVDDLRPVGEDWPAGHELAPAGTTLDAALASAGLSAGLSAVSVRGPVRAVIVTTGDEVLPADSPSPLPPGRIRDTVGPLLGPVLTRAGFVTGPGGPAAHCPDTADAVDALVSGAPDAVARAGSGDVLVLVGATGRGVADHLRPALRHAGARIVLDGVRVRPGGSQIVAVLPDGRVLVGLPGNPLAAISAAATTGRALVDALTGRERPPVLTRVAGLDGLAAPTRARVLPARPDGSGGWTLTGRVRTAHLADLAGAPVLAVVPEGAGPHDPVELVDWV